MLIYLTGLDFSVCARSANNHSNWLQSKDWNFIENKGQLKDLNNNVIRDVKYYGHQGSVSVYCRQNSIGFQFAKIENEDNDVSEATGTKDFYPYPKNLQKLLKNKTKVTINRADLVFLNANPDAQIIASDRREYYENYYTTGDANHGVTDVRSYKTITYQSIYPHIDLELLAKESGLKYNFIVHPGGDVKDIKLQWNGLDKMEKLKDSTMVYDLDLGKMQETKPVCFQGGDRICCDYLRRDNRISFKVKAYNKSKTLVIDPWLEWATYVSGGGGGFVDGENGEGISVDNAGYVYLVGESSNPDYIATTSAYQTSYQGNGDAFVSKFTSSGKIVWSTYYGGPGTEHGIDIAVFGTSSIYITGYTTSSSGIATTGAYQTSYDGKVASYYDAYLAKFSNAGKLIWGTYFGGDSTDGGDGVAVDPGGNVYIVGQTNSGSGIATAGAYQISYGGSAYSGAGDAFLAKFNSSGAVVWSTYYGGKNIDEGERVATDALGNIYFSGITSSSSNVATTGAYQTSFSGVTDGFLVKFNNSGSLQWATYFGGSATDYADGVCTDRSNNVYMTGSTRSSSGIASTGSFLTSLTGSSEAFLAKFNTNGKIQWSTYYGDGNLCTGSSVATDTFQNVYMAGSTTSYYGLATPGAYQTYNYSTYGTNSNDNALVVKFNGSGSRLWATYYGGNHADGAYSIAADDSGDIYFTGEVESTTHFATPGAYQTSLNDVAGAFIVKFGPPDAGIDSFFKPVSSCNNIQQVAVQLKNFGQIEIDSVTIFLTINGKTQKNYTWTGKLPPGDSTKVDLGNYTFIAGFDTLRSWTYMPNGDEDINPKNDTSKKFVIQIYPTPDANAGPDTTLCYKEVYMMKGSGGTTYLWHPAIFLSSDTNPKAVAILPNAEAYELVVTNKYGCVDSAPVILKIRPKLQVQAFSTDSVCYGRNAIIYAKGSGGDSAHYAFTWPYDSLTGDTIVKKVLKSGWHRVVLTDNCTPNSTTDSVYISIKPGRNVSILAMNDTACYGQNITMYAKISGKAGTNYSVYWPNDSVGGDTVSKNVYVSGWHNVILNDSCSIIPSRDSVYIVVISKPDIKAFVMKDTVCYGQSDVLYAKIAGGNNAHYSVSWPEDSLKGDTIQKQIFVSEWHKVIVNGNCGSAPAIDSVFIFVRPKLNVTALATSTSVCLGQSVTLYPKGSGGNNNQYSVSWPNDSISGSVITKKIFVSGWHKVVLTDSCSLFPATDSIYIKVRPKLQVNASASNSQVCYGQNVSFSATGSGGDSLHYIFSWPDDNNRKAVTFSEPIYTSGWHKVILTDNCTINPAIDSVYITVRPKLGVNARASNNPICYGKNETFSATGNGGDNAHYSFYWPDDTIKGANFTKKIVSSGWHIVVLKDSCGTDSAIDSIFILIRPKLQVKAFAITDTACYSQSVNLYAKGTGGDSLHYSFYWPGDSISGISISKRLFVSGWHRVVLKDSCSLAPATDSVYVTVRPKLVVKAFASSSSVCPGKPVSLYAKAVGGNSLNYSFFWPGDGKYGDTMSIKVFASGWHKVILSDQCTNNQSIDSVFVEVLPQTKASFTWSPRVIIENNPINFINQSSNASAYLWTFGDYDSSRVLSPVYTFNDSGLYKVTLIAYSSNPCPNDTVYANIKINPEIVIYVPNAFSPNGDGTNELFGISGSGIKDYTCSIYNRWGECIFKGSGAWDGSFRGQIVPEGVYLYQVNVTDILLQHHYLSGTVTVLK